MTRPSTRRRYLAAGVATGLAAVAGCSDLIENYDEAEETPDENSSDENSSDENSSEDPEEPVENIDYENPEGELEITEPEDGAQVESPVTFAMEVENFELQPAEADKPGDTDDASTPEGGAGHLHVIVDEGCMDPGYVIPDEDGLYHLSDGESETEIELEPGEHDICAQAGDDLHNAYAITDEITIEVTDEGNGGGNETESDGNETDDGNETES